MLARSSVRLAKDFEGGTVILFGKYLKKYYLKYWPFFLLGILALIVSDVAQTEIPKYLGEIVDTIEDISVERLWQILGIVLAYSGAILVSRIGWRLSIFYASRKIEAGLRHDLFLKAEKLPVSYYRENNVGKVMAWFTTDVETIGEFFGWGTVMLVDAAFLSVIVLIRMILLNPLLTLVAAIPIILIVIWGALVERFMTKKWDERQKAYDELYDFAQENFTGIRVIKAFVKENKEIRAFAKVAKKNADVNYSFGKISVTFDLIIELIIYFVIAIIMGFGGYFVFKSVQGEPAFLFGHEIVLSVGQLIEFTSYFDILIWPMIALGQIITMHSRSKASLRRITIFLDAPEDIKNPENAVVLKDVKGEVRFEHFNFRYPDETGEEDHLKDLTFTIKPGERVGVVGKIGSGKTTLANILLRLYNFQEGSVFVDGVDLMKADLTSLREAIAYAPQDNFLFSDTISNNIAFSDEKPNMDKVIRAAEFSDIDSNIQDFPNKYETVSGERGVTLSGGQKQRISLSRAYYKHSPILLMDDTVSAVDVKTEENILHNVIEKRAGLTTIVIASRVSTVRHFDKILVMVDGRVEAFGNHDELMETSPSYQKMVYLQQLEAEVQEGGKSWTKKKN